MLVQAKDRAVLKEHLVAVWRGLNVTHGFTKSNYLSGLQCHKRLWVEVNDPQRIPAIPKSQQRLTDQGTEVGIYARDQFPEGLLINGGPVEAIKKTEAAIKSNITTIFEAAFSFNDIFLRCDVIRKLSPTSWELIEVKASTKVKNEHLADLAIQKYVLLGCGLNVSVVRLMYINNQSCIYPDLSNLFALEDITHQVDLLLGEVPQRVQEFRVMLAEIEPTILISRHCDEPNPCALRNYCWQHVPEPSIFTIPRLSKDKQNELVNQGVLSLSHLPLGYSLTAKQRTYVDNALSATLTIDHEGIKSELHKLEYPIHFIDFETYNPAIPRFDGLKPYCQFPFQYSCHVWNVDETMSHHEYLHSEDSDPRPLLIKSLLSHISDTGSVIVYNCPFERSVLTNLAEAFPQHAQQLQSIISRLWDQLEIFKQYYNHPNFKGSNSIKNVLPVLVPSLSYSELRVQKGDEAQAVWEMLIKATNELERSNYIRDLKEYCKMDTWAMVEIHRVLDEIIAGPVF